MRYRSTILNHIQLSVSEGVLQIDPADIIRLKASSNYTYIYFTNRPPLLIATVLRKLEAVLSGFGFIRIHRTHLVNRRYISHVTENGQIFMSDATVTGISRRMKPQVMRKLNAAA